MLPKLFLPAARKNCCSDQENILKFEAESLEFAKFLRSLAQFIQTVNGQNSSNSINPIQFYSHFFKGDHLKAFIQCRVNI